jgi:hypothetical protein
MKRQATIISIGAAILVIAVIAIPIQNYLWLKSEERRIKAEVAQTGAESNYSEGVAQFLEHGRFVGYKSDGWAKYQFDVRPRISISGEHDGWISKRPDGTYYIKIY